MEQCVTSLFNLLVVILDEMLLQRVWIKAWETDFKISMIPVEAFKNCQNLYWIEEKINVQKNLITEELFSVNFELLIILAN